MHASAVVPPAKVEVLQSIDSRVQELMADHCLKRRLWFPSEIAGPPAGSDPRAFADELRTRAAGISGPVRATIILNMLTEEGLPHFHRIMSRIMGGDSTWVTWRDAWTAEEERHGAVMQLWVHASGAFDDAGIERMLFAYINSGFVPDWNDDPYRMLAYTSMQERATQISHRATGRLAGAEEPVIGDVLNRVAAEEARHFVFYRGVFQAVLDRDPNGALAAFAHVITHMDMPGVSMPRFGEFAEVVRRLGVYGPEQFLGIVEDHIKAWGIEGLRGLTPEGQQAQEAILAAPVRLRRVAEIARARQRPRTFAFADVCQTDFAMA